MLGSRTLAATLALAWSLFSSLILARHFVGAPDGVMSGLLLAPALACLITLAGVAGESLGRGARAAQFVGLGLLSWRSLWMFFSWDGMLLFPAWCLLAMALMRRRERVAEAA